MIAQLTSFSRALLLFLTISIVFSASCLLTASNMPARITEGGDTSVAAAIMDAGRTAVSAYLYEKADLYFHAGKQRKTTLAFTGSPFQKLASQLNPTEHVHITGKGVEEILPWLWMAIRADPHNLQHYFVASFWLAHETGRPDLARALLAEARWNNPYSYTVAMEDAMIALKNKQIGEASLLLDAGLAFWERNAPTRNEDERSDKARMLLYRALLHEAAGNAPDAIRLLEEILALYPARKGIHARIDELKAGDRPSLLASGAWSDILRSEIDSQREHNCEYDDHDHAKGCKDENCKDAN